MAIAVSETGKNESLNYELIIISSLGVMAVEMRKRSVRTMHV